MNDFKGIVYLTQEQYDILKRDGKITVNDITINYDENTLYVTELKESTDFLSINGGTISGDILLDKRLTEPNIIREPSISFATYNNTTPYIGYSKTKADGSFIIGSIGNHNDENFDDTKNTLIFTPTNELRWKGKLILTEAEGRELYNHLNSDIELKANQTQVTQLSESINAHDTSIKQLLNAINDKADTTTVEEQLGAKANTQYVNEELNKKANSIKIETISANNWEQLLNKDPYKFKSIVAVTTKLSDNSIVELYNDNPILFSTYGLMIGEIQGQLLTIYCIKQPQTTLTLKIGVQN